MTNLEIPQTKTCILCKFFVINECFRFPPVVYVRQLDDKISQLRPKVNNETLICGEFIKIPEKNLTSSSAVPVDF